MKKRKLWTLILALVVIIGGITMFTLNQKMTENQQKRELETSIAKLLVHDYENVKEIEFKGWGYSRETGTWGTTVIVNANSQINLSFSGLSTLKEIYSIRYNPSTFKLKEKVNIERLEPIKDRVTEIESVSLNDIEVKHSIKLGE
ncbi:hypothetical protein E4T82_01655 [Streptococcus cuniculi]|uniref:DUF1433 domain-containing protein n=2 Tax=Streptococcus cuniculi TaxID=1432788 RepID=A0A4Y9JFQ1_9STRE|nr:hypothetical protein [Streptococcus cuniculi]MBF0777443.1 hypothetical protein [Streptococcus cuniculi]TFU98704.1 hypothetical protein E4T82_01655 [Streptococcus cuniculi]